jgi:hypothetical protein
MADIHRELLEDVDNYTSVFKYKGLEKNTALLKSLPQITVWIWCKALSKTKMYQTKDLDGTILNITPFIKDLNTTVTKQSGTFSFSLPPLVAMWAPEGWRLQNVDYLKNRHNLEFVSKNALYAKDSSIRNQFFFHNVIGENDVVFIRFETLKREIVSPAVYKQIENKSFVSRLNTTNFLEISESDIPGNIFDMIGLVDSNELSGGATDLNFSINIQGRDLSKLLVEDGCYFFPLDYVPGGIFANEAEQDYIDRIDGKLSMLSQETTRNIEYTLKFIINTLSRIKICSDKLFEPYGDKDAEKDIFGIYQNGKSKARDLAGLGRSKKFALNIESRIAKEQSRTKLREEKIKVCNKINECRIAEGLTTLGAKLEVLKISPIFDELLAFLKFLKKNNYIVLKDKLINWNITKDIYKKEKLVSNIFPSLFDDYLYRSIWVINDVDLAAIRAKIAELKKQFTLLLIQNTLTDSDRKLISQLKKAGVFDYSTKNILSKEQKEIINRIDLTGQNRIITTVDPNNTYVETGREQAIKDMEARIGQSYYEGLTEEQKKDYDAAKDWSEGITVTEINDPRLKAICQEILELEKQLVSRYIRIPKNINDLRKSGQDAVYMAYQYIFKEEEEANVTETYEEKYLRGIWQIVKLVVDEEQSTTNDKTTGSNIGARRCVDSTIGNENGSIITAINKICQEPWVEFFGDTYGDQYYFIVRQPPFTKEAFADLVEHAIDVFEEDVISDSLTFANDSSYSWYRLTPQASFSELGENTVLAYVKALHFPEYADIWGERPLDIVSNYVQFHSLVGNKQDDSIGYLVMQSLYDLKFLIDTNMYLPFTRKGTITINGDRRIKRGTVIRYKGTGEVFYVDGVTNSASISTDNIDRKTTLTVSRGMMESHFNIYFQIIDTHIDPEKVNAKVDYETNIKTVYENFRVNKEIFDFLLKRKQFLPVKEASIGIGTAAPRDYEVFLKYPGKPTSWKKKIK